MLSDVTSQEALSELGLDRNLEGRITGSRFLLAKLMAILRVVEGAASLEGRREATRTDPWQGWPSYGLLPQRA